MRGGRARLVVSDRLAHSRAPDHVHQGPGHLPRGLSHAHPPQPPVLPTRIWGGPKAKQDQDLVQDEDLVQDVAQESVGTRTTTWSRTRSRSKD